MECAEQVAGAVDQYESCHAGILRRTPGHGVTRAVPASGAWFWAVAARLAGSRAAQNSACASEAAKALRFMCVVPVTKVNGTL